MAASLRRLVKPAKLTTIAQPVYGFSCIQATIFALYQFEPDHPIVGRLRDRDFEFDLEAGLDVHSSH